MPNFAVKDEHGKILGFSSGETQEDALFNYNNGHLLMLDVWVNFVELPPVIVEKDKYYFCRNNAIAGPMVPNLSKLYAPEWTWALKSTASTGGFWRDDGIYRNDSEYDLMCEYIPV